MITERVPELLCRFEGADARRAGKQRERMQGERGPDRSFSPSTALGVTLMTRAKGKAGKG